MLRLALTILLATVGLALGACGDDEETTSTSTSSTSTSTTTEAVAPTDSENVNEDFGYLPPDLEVDEREGTPPPEGIGETEVEAAAEAAGCEYGDDFRDEGNEHFTNEEREVDYETSPPTSGPHFFSPREVGAGALADGAFLGQAPDSRVVHSLEHGRVAIQYSPDLAEEDQLALKGLFDADRPGLLLFPNAEMPWAVAASAWTALLGCETYEGEATLEAIAAFREEFRGQGPEPVAF